jgi:hypothetical protein
VRRGRRKAPRQYDSSDNNRQPKPPHHPRPHHPIKKAHAPLGGGRGGGQGDLGGVARDGHFAGQVVRLAVDLDAVVQKLLLQRYVLVRCFLGKRTLHVGKRTLRHQDRFEKPSAFAQTPRPTLTDPMGGDPMTRNSEGGGGKERKTVQSQPTSADTKRATYKGRNVENALLHRSAAVERKLLRLARLFRLLHTLAVAGTNSLNRLRNNGGGDRGSGHLGKMHVRDLISDWIKNAP